MTDHCSWQPQNEDGASLVEFALILPLFVMLLLGMFTGGLAYNTKLSLTSATREASRYGATLAVSPDCGGSAGNKVDDWLNCVATVAVNSSNGELTSTVASRYVCVSYVNPGGVLTSDDRGHSTRTLELTGAGGPVYSATDCFTKKSYGADGFGSTQARVQVVVTRDRKLEALLFTQNLSLSSRSVTVYEAAG
ncbi:MAG: TadE-like protein [Actinomycetota bacterium]|nr:TadE-like protein [Actinomycetota bacterium]